jgi:hypothetical protein
MTIDLGDISPAQSVAGVDIAELVQTVETALGQPVSKVACPGGRDRAIFRVYMGADSVIVSKRSYAKGAALERRILDHLAPLTNHFPQILADLDGFLIQTDMGVTSLAQSMQNADHAGKLDLFNRAIQSVFSYQMDIGHPFPETEILPLHMKPDDLDYFLQGPLRTGAVFGARMPGFDWETLRIHFQPTDACFVKWDNRVANAALSANGTIGWFDFEDSRLGAGYEDLAWLAADEFPALSFDDIYPLLEAEIAMHHGLAAPIVLRRFHIMSCLLIAMRARRIGRHLQKKGKWYTLAEINRSDRVGAHPDLVRALLKRGQAFAMLEPETKPLKVMFQDIENSLDDAAGGHS